MTSPAQSEPDQSTAQDRDNANANMQNILALVLIAAISLVAVSTVFGLIFASVAGAFDHDDNSQSEVALVGVEIIHLPVPSPVQETVTAGDREVSLSVAEFLLTTCEPSYVRVIDMVNSYAACVPVWSIDPTGQVVVNPYKMGEPSFKIPTVND